MPGVSTGPPSTHPKHSHTHVQHPHPPTGHRPVVVSQGACLCCFSHARWLHKCPEPPPVNYSMPARERGAARRRACGSTHPAPQPLAMRPPRAGPMRRTGSRCMSASGCRAALRGRACRHHLPRVVTNPGQLELCAVWAREHETWVSLWRHLCVMCRTQVAPSCPHAPRDRPGAPLRWACDRRAQLLRSCAPSSPAGPQA